MNEELSQDIKNGILADKLNRWRGTLYDAGLDGKVAGVVNNPKLQKIAERRVKEALQAIEYLEALLTEVDAGEDKEAGDADPDL